MKTHSLISTLAVVLLGVTANATTLQLSYPATVTFTGKLRAPSGAWGWSMNRAGSITITDTATGNTAAEKIWNDFSWWDVDHYAERDATVTGSAVSKPLTFTVDLPAGNYDWVAQGSYSQGSAGYLWSEVSVSETAVETWNWVTYTTNFSPWSEWTPDTSTVDEGHGLTQTRTRTYDERKKEVSNFGAERNDQFVQTLTETESRPAVGTRPLSATPVVTFDDITKIFGDAPFALTSSSTGGGTPTYSIVSEIPNAGGVDVITLDGSTVTIMGGGTATVRVDYPANGSFIAASKIITVLIKRRPRTIIAPDRIDAMVDDPMLTLSAEVRNN